MKLAFVKMPPTYADWYKQPFLGISYISSYLESKGYECNLFDAYYHSWSYDELYDKVMEYEPDVIGITAMTYEVIRASQFAEDVKKERNITAIVGGPHVTALPERTLDEFVTFDFGVHGEGEFTALELLKAIENNGDFSSIKGLVYRDDNNQVKVNKERPWITGEELSEIPYPGYHFYYGSNPKALVNKNDYYVMYSNRGCPYSCKYCMTVLGKKVRARSPEHVIGEMEFAIKTYGAHTFCFEDEIFLFPSNRTSTILQMMIDRGLPKKIRWSGLTRPGLVDEEIIDLAKKAGCYMLGMGVESGDDKILKATDHLSVGVEQIEKSVKLIQSKGINVGAFYILGHPFETRETLDKTADLAVRLNTSTVAVGIMVPYPGTAVYNMAKKGEAGYTLLSENWSDYDKYFGGVLAIEDLPIKLLEKYQKKIIINFYFKNFRFIELFSYIWAHRTGLFFALKRWLFPKESSKTTIPVPSKFNFIK